MRELPGIEFLIHPLPGTWISFYTVLLSRMRELPGIEFLIHPLPGTQDQLQDKLKELANKINNRSIDCGKCCMLTLIMNCIIYVKVPNLNN